MAKGSQVELPAGLDEDFEVFLNGVPQRAGVDFQRVGSRLVFPRELVSEGKLGFWRWLSIALGVAGTYRRDDTVDLVHRVNGRRVVTTIKAEPLASEPGRAVDPG